jgi:sulfate permease, SulP family
MNKFLLTVCAFGLTDKATGAVEGAMAAGASSRTGTTFGELALIDEGLRSTTVMADDYLICYSLSKDDFAALANEEPAVAIKLLASLARELSKRLRVANGTIQELEL